MLLSKKSSTDIGQAQRQFRGTTEEMMSCSGHFEKESLSRASDMWKQEAHSQLRHQLTAQWKLEPLENELRQAADRCGLRWTVDREMALLASLAGYSPTKTSQFYQRHASAAESNSTAPTAATVRKHLSMVRDIVEFLLFEKNLISNEIKGYQQLHTVLEDARLGFFTGTIARQSLQSRRLWKTSVSSSLLIGRDAILESLQAKAIAENAPNLIHLAGIEGIGKASVAHALGELLSEEGFELVWFELDHGPTLSRLIKDQLFKTFTPDLDTNALEFGDLLEELTELLDRKRLYIVFKNIDELLEQGKFRNDRQDYRQFFKRLHDQSLSSIVVTTASGIPKQFRSSRAKQSGFCHDEELAPLSEADSLELLQAGGLKDPDVFPSLHQNYAGNPGLLKTIMLSIHQRFDGSARQFKETVLENGTVDTPTCGARFYDYWLRLSEAEKQVLKTVALANVPISLNKIAQQSSISFSSVMEICEHLSSNVLRQKPSGIVFSEEIYRRLVRRAIANEG